MFVLALFGHIVGALILFAAFALEWVILGERPELASVLPRLHGTAGVVLVLTGSYMARQLGVWHNGWMAVSLASLVILAAGGMVSGARRRALGTSSRGDAWLVASLRVRLSVALGVVYLMVATPDFALSITVVAAAALVGAAVAFPVWRAARGAAASRKVA
jgi:hypothetical protein